MTIRMDILHHFPLPSKWSVLLLSGGTLFTYFNKLSHTEITFFLSCFSYICALISYGYKFIKWFVKIKVKKIKEKKDEKINL